MSKRFFLKDGPFDGLELPLKPDAHVIFATDKRTNFHLYHRLGFYGGCYGSLQEIDEHWQTVAANATKLLNGDKQEEGEEG